MIDLDYGCVSSIFKQRSDVMIQIIIVMNEIGYEICLARHTVQNILYSLPKVLVYPVIGF